MPPAAVGPGADPNARAQQVLERGQAHVNRWLSGWSALGQAWTDMLSTALAEQKYPPDKWLPDALTLSLNALDLLMCGCGSDPGSVATTIERGVDPPEPSDIEFDIMSEMAGPMVFTPGSETLSIAGMTDLVATPLNAAGGAIPAANVLVRVLGAKVMVTLVGLKELVIPPGTYEGNLTLDDSVNGPGAVQVEIRAICRDSLFWRP